MNILYFDSEDDLFHYTKLSTAIEHILPEKRLKLSLLKDTNDPAEYKYKILFALGVRTPVPDNMADCLCKTEAVANSIYNKCRVLCFCSNKKPTLIPKNTKEIEDKYGCSKGWERSRMWSQYAEGHAGICLVFSKKKLEENLKNTQPTIDYETDYVKYYQHKSAPTTFNTNGLTPEVAEVYGEKHIRENYKEFFYQKHIDYRDEAEYRTIIFNQEVEYLDIGSSIKGVIAGDRTSKVYYPLIEQLCDSLKIESRRVSWNSGIWRLATLRSK